MTKIRIYFYLASGLLASVIPILLAMGVITEGQGNSWLAAAGAVGSLIGASGAITAGTMLKKQVNHGVLGSNPVDQVINNIPVVVQQARDAVQNLDRIREAAVEAITATPVVGPLAEEIIDQITRSLPKF